MQMPNAYRLGFGLVAVLLMALAGCPRVDVVDDPAPQPAETDTPDDPAAPDPVLLDPPEPEPEEPPPPTIPTVSLTESLRATCLVFVDDQFPEGDLTDLDGTEHSMRDVLGPELTVVVFWNRGNVHSVFQLEDLARDFAEPLADRGGRIVAINVGDAPEEAAEAAREADADFLILLDPDRAYFGKVATEGLPRTYVLDADGTILWFDLEYSRSTRRLLEQTIEAALSGEPAP